MRSRESGILLILVTAWIASGCATPTLEPSASEKFRGKDMAVSVFVLDKSIQYDEMVYKVLWNETRTHRSKFEGFWDVDQSLTNAMAESMGEVGLKARPISSILKDKEYGEFVAALKGTRNSDGTYAPLDLAPSTRKAMKKAGIGSIAIVRSAHFMISTTVFNSSGLMHLPSVFVVYDVDSGEQAYAHRFPVAGGVKWGDSVRDIESNNLQILRDSSPVWMQNSVKREIPKIFNLQ